MAGPRRTPTRQALVAKATRDLCEFLMELKAEGMLDLEFPKAPKSIAYHLPCHLKVQKSATSRATSSRLTGAAVTTVEKCSGHDGTWAMKVEYFDESMKVGKKLFDAARSPRTPRSSRPTARSPSVQIHQGTSRPVKHPDRGPAGRLRDVPA